MNITNHEFMKPTKAYSYSIAGSDSTQIETKGSYAILKITSGSVYAAGLEEKVSSSNGFVLDTGDTLCFSHGINLLVKSSKDSTAATATVLFLESN